MQAVPIKDNPTHIKFVTNYAEPFQKAGEVYPIDHISRDSDGDAMVHFKSTEGDIEYWCFDDEGYANGTHGEAGTIPFAILIKEGV